MPDLRQLRTFVAVAEELSFTRAAQRLYLGQQAVSKAVRQLERAREVGRGLSGTVRIGATPAIGPAEREQVAQTLRDGASDLSVSLLEVRPGDIRRLLRNRSVDIVLARTIATTEGIDSAPLRPTTAVLWVSITHPLAAAPSVRLAQIDGARLLTWNPPGTPFTDLILDRLGAAGCTVEPVQARVTGAAHAAELASSGAVALMPAGWPPSEGIAAIPLEDDAALPLLMLWRAGIPTPAVERLRAELAPPAPHPEAR